MPDTTPTLRDRIAQAARDLGHPQWDAVALADAVLTVLRPATQPEIKAAVADLPARLRTVLTDRYTALGNPFSEMRYNEEGPDGWPASHPVSPDLVAEVLRELMADAPARQVLGTPTADPAACVHPEGFEGECPCPPSCPCCDVTAAALQPASAPAAPILEPQDHPGADLFVALRAAGLDADEANRRMYAYAGMILRQEKATASAPAAPTDRATDRRDRYAAAILDALARDTTRGPHWGAAADAAMAVADAEQAALRAEAEGLDEALRGLISASDKDVARLRADRAAVLREAANALVAGPVDNLVSAPAAFTEAIEMLRRMADEVQPTETERDPACGRCNHPLHTGHCPHFAGTAGACQCPARQRREPHPTEADLAHALALLNQLPATAATEEPQP
ncbi:hypothetical protein OHR86_27985 [Streptomyces sp. NBC_00441]|uniref:hypothetical protein n=1 Tax=Streptomyces sp. NBC_00441 TaxID=2975742 RepID=UPI002E2E844A|nr:hypothetical protein [Streptomyces sp. NBC_00441]